MNVKSLGYVVIETTDLAQWRVFGTEVVGMMAVPGAPSDAGLYLKMDARPWRFAVRPGEADRLLICGWELPDRADFEHAREELTSAGVELTEGSAGECRMRRVQELLRFHDPAGNCQEVYWGGELDYAPFVSPVGLAGFITGFNGDMGLGHAVLPAPNLVETHAFGDTDYMHFHFSEDPGDPGQGLNFMHVQNPRHHSLALFQAEMPSGCVHLMVEVPGIDDVGYCLDRVLKPSGFSLEFGCEGLQMDWATYTPTRSTLPSLWGHEFQMPE